MTLIVDYPSLRLLIYISVEGGQIDREGWSVYLNIQQLSNYVWVSLDKVMDLPLTGPQRRRIGHIVTYLETGKKALG